MRICLALASLLLLPTIGKPADPSAADAGWYQDAKGGHILLTLGASRGLRFADMDTLAYEHLDPTGPHTYTWTHSKKKFKATITHGGQTLLEAKSEDGETPKWTLDKSAPYSISEESYRNHQISLDASLLMPQGSEPVPAVVIVHGSGESHRDNMWYQYQADYLAKHGIAVLLPDKRGCGQSSGDWHTASFEDLADDVTAGIAQLRKNLRIDSRRIGLFGLSQGGWIAPLAANRSVTVRFVIDVSGAAVTPGTQVRHEILNSLVEAHLTRTQIDQAMQLQDAAEAYIRGGSWQRYVEVRKDTLTKPWAEFASHYPETPKHWQWPWWRKVIDFDPAKEIGRLQVPCLVMYGRKDEQENVPVGLSLLRLADQPNAGKSLTVKVFPQSGHAMGDPKTGWILTEYLQFVSDWIRQR